MAVVLRELVRSYRLWVYEYSDQRTIDWPLMSSPIPVILIAGLYLWFVLKLGPAFMKNRQPFQLDKAIQLYNIVQVVLCGFLSYEGITRIYGPWGRYSIICQPLDLEETDFNIEILQRFYLYFTLKILDLLDTVFFVLRKKQSQVTFLHVYHHALMVILIWVAMRFLPGGQVVYIGVINSFVHTVMYAYYFLTNYDKEYRKNLWWKKHITQLQLFQFASITLHSLILLVQPSCEYPKLLVFMLFPQNLFMFFLFLDFYKKTYYNPVAKTVPAKTE